MFCVLVVERCYRRLLCLIRPCLVTALLTIWFIHVIVIFYCSFLDKILEVHHTMCVMCSCVCVCTCECVCLGLCVYDTAQCNWSICLFFQTPAQYSPYQDGS